MLESELEILRNQIEYLHNILSQNKNAISILNFHICTYRK